MSEINQKTGYYGFTLAGTEGGAAVDKQGLVNRCIFSISYPVQATDIEFTISEGEKDWAACMGDGSIIPLSNPKILYQNRDNSIIQFDMATKYPSNSPCLLVYRSDTAKFNIKPITTKRPFAPNSVSGHFAFTIEGYGGTPQANGYVNRLLATIPFPAQVADVVFTITDDPSHWGARMGDGSIITLRDPEVLFTNNDNAVVQFTMDTYYPSNSPCILIYRSADASFNIKVGTGEEKFIPVTDIKGVPERIATGVTTDLSSVSVYPYNATMQRIDWTVVSGPGSIEGDQLTTTSNGTVVLKATVTGAKADGSDFTKSFSLSVIRNVITITAQPLSDILFYLNEISGNITINASSTTGQLKYQWYSNTVNAHAGGTRIAGATNSYYTFPTNLSAGDHYYYCEVSSPGATSVKSNVCKATVSVALVGIEIVPNTETINIGETRHLTVRGVPENAEVPPINWFTSNDNVLQIDRNGNLTVITSGNATITASTDDGKHKNILNLTIPEYHAVTDVQFTTNEIDAKIALELTATVLPANATNKTITWSIFNAGTTGAKITNGILTTTGPGRVIIRATIAGGITPTRAYSRDFGITINKAFVPVSDVTFKDLPSDIYCNKTVALDPVVNPDDATNREVVLTVLDRGTAGATLESGVLTFTGSGKCKIRATVVNGASKTSNYMKDFEFTVQSAFVPVTSVSVTPEVYDPNPVNGAPTTLVFSVAPANASKKAMTLRFVKCTEDIDAVFNPDTKELSANPEMMDSDMDASVDIEVTIEDGIDPGVDYVSHVTVGIQPPPPKEVYIPVESYELKLPEPFRCHYPALLGRGIYYPWNCSTKGVAFLSERAQEYGGADTVIYNPNSTMEGTWVNDHTNKDPFFDWNLDEPYLFPYDPGKTKVQAIVLSGGVLQEGATVPDDFIQEYELTMLPPYISVKDISNIPLRIPCNQDFILSGECETNGGIKYHNPTWDEEEPSYSDIVWRMGAPFINTTEYPNTAGATLINGNTIRATKPGTFTIQAYIENGTKEAINWYDKTQIGEPFTKLFTIEAVDEELPMDAPIVTLTLNSGKVVSVYTIGDFMKLCTDRPADDSITIDNTTFRKNQVTEVKFWDDSTIVVDNSKLDPTVPVEGINGLPTKMNTRSWVRPQMSGGTYSPGPNAETDFSAELEDGTIVADDGTMTNPSWGVPDTWVKLPNGSILNSRGEIVLDLGTRVLNKLHADSIFHLYPQYINLQGVLTYYKYDGIVGIPDGTFLGQDGSLHIFQDDKEAYEINVHGMVFDKREGHENEVILPMDSVLDLNQECIRLPDATYWKYKSNTYEYPSEIQHDDTRGDYFTTLSSIVCGEDSIDITSYHFLNGIRYNIYNSSSGAEIAEIVDTIDLDDGSFTIIMKIPDTRDPGNCDWKVYNIRCNGYYETSITLKSVMASIEGHRLSFDCPNHVINPPFRDIDLDNPMNYIDFLKFGTLTKILELYTNCIRLMDGTIVTMGENPTITMNSNYRASVDEITWVNEKLYNSMGYAIFGGNSVTSMGTGFTSDGRIIDYTGSQIPSSTYKILNNVTVTPAEASNKEIDWETQIIPAMWDFRDIWHEYNDSPYVITTPHGHKMIIAGYTPAFVVLRPTIANGLGWRGQDYISRSIVEIGNTGYNAEKRLYVEDINITPITKEIFAGEVNSSLDVKANIKVLGSIEDTMLKSLQRSIQWWIDGDVQPGTFLELSEDGETATLNIDPTQSPGDEIEIHAHVPKWANGYSPEISYRVRELIEVPEGLAGTSSLNTISAIEERLSAKLPEGLDGIVYRVIPVLKDDATAVTPSEMPVYGINVTIPYPENTVNHNYEFTAVFTPIQDGFKYMIEEPITSKRVNYDLESIYTANIVRNPDGLQIRASCPMIVALGYRKIDSAYEVNIGNIANGFVSSNKTYAYPGDTVTITATPDDGYTVNKIFVYLGQKGIYASKQSSTTYTFIMPEGNVIINASFKAKDFWSWWGQSGSSESEESIVEVSDNKGGFYVSSVLPEGTAHWSAKIVVKLIAKPMKRNTTGVPDITSLRNFGRNFTNLKKIDKIPAGITGDDCLRNFLRGCTSLNCAITVPEGVTGDRCMKYFLRGCTSFNSKVTIANSVTGDGCLHGFLYGCTKFNQPVIIPEGVTGESCLERFLMKCKTFNQPIDIPAGVSGAACLRDFLTEAWNFNQPITIPSEIKGNRSLAQFMRDAKSMISNVTISHKAATYGHENAQTFSSVYQEGPSIDHGIPLIGSGARVLMGRLHNYLEHPPYINLTTFEDDAVEVEINGISVENAVYDGNPHVGYTGEILTNYEGELSITWVGISETDYPYCSDAPSDPGQYRVTIEVPPADAKFYGSVSFDFTIAANNS